MYRDLEDEMELDVAPVKTISDPWQPSKRERIGHDATLSKLRSWRVA